MALKKLGSIVFIFTGALVASVGSDSPTAFDDLVRQGRAAFLASDLDRAESAYNQACPAGLVSTLPVAKAVTCENLLASVDEARGNLARAEQRFLHAVAGAEQAGPAYLPLYCAKLVDLGEHYHRQGRTADAEASLLKAVDLARTLTTVQPELLPEALTRLGGLYAESPDPERGRAPLTEALAIIETSENAGKRAVSVTELAYTRDCLGMVDLAAGRQREAEANLRESVALAAGALGEDHPVTAAYQTNLAVTLIAAQQFSRASMLLRRAEYVVGSQGRTPGSELAVICAQMSIAASGEGKLAVAEDYARRAISILNAQQRPNVRAIAAAQITLAGIHLRNHDVAAAERILPQALATQRELGVTPDVLAASVQLLAELRVQQRNWQAADALYREAIGIRERQGLAAMNPALAPLLRALAEVLKHEGGSKGEVQALESRARDILKSAPQSGPRA